MPTVDAASETALPRCGKRAEDIEVDFAFIITPSTRKLVGIGTEEVARRLLTGLMVFIFLRDWRSVIVVVLNIPLLGAATSHSGSARFANDDARRPRARGRQYR